MGTSIWAQPRMKHARNAVRRPRLNRISSCFPRFGYTTAAWDPPKPPGRNLDRVGKVLTTATGFSLSAVTNKESDFANVRGLTALYYEAGQGELLIRNAGDKNYGFALCTRCGFAMSEEKATQS